VRFSLTAYKLERLLAAQTPDTRTAHSPHAHVPVTKVSPVMDSVKWLSVLGFEVTVTPAAMPA